ncbi:MAG TPA: RDD family protein [Bacillus bacterium]|nr:RDD family protein [Bacillus sp. (in: firmicutes)]
MEHTVEEHVEQTVEKTLPSVQVYNIYAGFWIRFYAYLIDLVVVGSLNRIIIYPILRWLDVSISETSMLSTVAISTALVMFVYFVVMTKIWGQTLGKMILGLKVISEKDAELSWGTVLFRELIGKFISKTVLFLGFITISFTSKKKGWHDFFADTIVIQERKGFVLQTSNLKIS